MSVNALNRLCREILRDHAFRAAMKSDPAAVIAKYSLRRREARAAGRRRGDTPPHGVNDFMMGYMAASGRAAGLASFNEKIRSIPH